MHKHVDKCLQVGDAETPEQMLQEHLADNRAPSGAQERWPDGVSDGLTLPCGFCGTTPRFDYHVSDDFWQRVVPKVSRLGVVCLPCLDQLAYRAGEDLAASLEEVQWIGIGQTVVLRPEFTHRYEPAGQASAPAHPQVERATLVEAHAVLAAFARTAPGRLPAEVQAAVDLAPWDGSLIRGIRALSARAEESERYNKDSLHRAYERGVRDGLSRARSSPGHGDMGG